MPFEDGVWARLNSGALVLMEKGLPIRVRRSTQGRAMVETELSVLTGHFLSLDDESDRGDGWKEATVTPLETLEALRRYRAFVTVELAVHLKDGEANTPNAKAAEERLYEIDRAFRAYRLATPDGRRETEEVMAVAAPRRKS